MRDKTGLYYHPQKNQLELFQIDRSCPSMGVDYSWYAEGFGWSKTKKGVPSDHGWIFIDTWVFL